MLLNYVKSWDGLIRHGVARGSNLEPLLLFFYVNRIINTQLIQGIALYADDTNIFVFWKYLPDILHSCKR